MKWLKICSDDLFFFFFFFFFAFQFLGGGAQAPWAPPPGHAPGLQKLLDVCYSFSQCNDIVFNSLKSVYIVFRSKRYKLCCPTVSLHSDKLNRIPETEYLGYLLSKDQSDDEDIAKQIRTLYIRSNKLLRTV